MIYFTFSERTQLKRMRRDKLQEEKVVRLEALHECAVMHGEDDKSESVGRRMTADAALKEISRQERRFEKIGFRNGLMLAKSAREYLAEMVALHGKVAAAAKAHKADKDMLAKLEAESTRLGQHGKCNPKIVRLRRKVKSGERLINREHVAQLRLEEKVRRLAVIP